MGRVYFLDVCVFWRYRDACRDLKERFVKDFDWTKALQS